MGKRKPAAQGSPSPAKRARGRKGGAQAGSPLRQPLALELSQEAPRQGTLDELLQPRRGGTRGAAGAATPAAAPSAAAAAGKLPATSAGVGGLWCDRHAPCGEDDIVVAKPKVVQLRSWMAALKEHRRVPHCMLLTGPPGCGKSSTVRALAHALGFELCAWTPPVPTSWEEHRYQGGASTGYTSKVADFEEFAGHAKLAALALVPSDAAGRNTAAAAATGSPQNAEGGWPDMRGSSATGGGGGWRHSQATEAAAALPPAPRPKLLLLDDLPHAAGAEQRARITAAITRLAQGCSGATAVVVEMTDGGREDSGGSGRSQAASMRGLQRDIADALEGLSAASLLLNPATTAATSKVLHAVAAAHGLALAKEDATALAEASGGDLRSAVCNLQFVATGVKQGAAAAPAAPPAKGRGSRSRAKKQPTGTRVPIVAARQMISKDATLGMFHGLGKILYNKRQAAGSSGANGGKTTAASSPCEAAGTADGAAAGAGTAAALPGGGRPHPEADVEAVLEQSGMEPGPVSSFLHEHYASFVPQDAVEDAALALEYLVASDALCAYWGALDVTADMGSYRTQSLTAAIAGSVAARGWMWSNRRPAPRRWLPLDAPTMPTVQRAAAQNRDALRDVLHDAGAAAGLVCDVTAFATSYLPALRALSCAAGPQGAAAAGLLPRKWLKVWNKRICVESEARGSGSSAALQGLGAGRAELPSEGGVMLHGADDGGFGDAIEDSE